jgi:hypothetical protein
MTSPRRSWLLLGLVVASCLGHARPAVAQTSKVSCLTAFEEGQRKQLKGELERAAEQFASCASPSCPTRVRAECQSFLDTARSSIPGVLFAPVDSSNERPLDGVSLSVDGREGQSFDGRMVRMEPGEHHVLFQRPGYSAIRLRLVLRAGEPPRLIPLRFKPSLAAKPALRDKSGAAVSPGEDLPRPVASGDGALIDCAPAANAAPSATLAQRDPPPRAQASNVVPQRGTSAPARPPLGPRRTAALAAGVVGGLGAVGFAYFGLSARSADVGLDACTPNCEPSKVDAIKRDYVMANVSLGLGFAGALTASLLWLTSPRAERPARASSGAPRTWAVAVGPVTTLTAQF